MKPIDLQGHRVLVTGAAGILGRAFCIGLWQGGARVVALDRDEDGLGELAATFDAPDGLTFAACDISDERDVQRTVDALWSSEGPITGLVNNAASKSSSLDSFFADIRESSLETWRDVMSVNLDGSYLMAREVGSRMADANGGSIVQISSIYGVLGPDQRIYEGSEYLGRPISSPAVYSASKAGVIGLARFLATRWAAEGVRVNVVTPGGVSSGQNETFETNYSNRIPMGRMATEADLVGPVAFLLSDAASYVTGQNLVVDGGLTAW